MRGSRCDVNSTSKVLELDSPLVVDIVENVSCVTSFGFLSFLLVVIFNNLVGKKRHFGHGSFRCLDVCQHTRAVEGDFAVVVKHQIANRVTGINQYEMCAFVFDNSRARKHVVL